MFYRLYDNLLWFVRGTIKKLPLKAAFKRNLIRNISSYRDVLEVEHLVSLTPNWVFEPNGEKVIMPSYTDACPYGMINEYKDPGNIEIRVREHYAPLLFGDSQLSCYRKRISNEVVEPNEGFDSYQKFGAYHKSHHQQ